MNRFVAELEAELRSKNEDTWPNAGKASEPTLELQAPALYGLAGDIVKTILPYTEADPVALLAYLLDCFGNVIGHNAHWRMEHTNHYLNLFVVLVGRSFHGRKGTSRSTLDHIFRQIDHSWQSERTKSGLSSGQGLIWAVRDPIKEKRSNKEKSGKVRNDHEDVVTDAGESDKRLLVVEEEFSQALKSMPLDGNILSVVIRQAWDSGNLRSLTSGRKTKPVTASDAHISIVGHITAEELLRYLDSTEQANGFANRFLWFCVARSKVIPNPTGAPDSLLEPLIDRLVQAVAFGAKMGEMRRDDKAEKIWAPVYAKLTDPVPGMVGAITARGAPQVMRLASLYALLDLSATIRPEHLMAALSLWDYSCSSAKIIFGETIGDPIADKIWNAILQSDTGLTASDLYDLFSRHNSERIDRAIALLLRLALIEETVMPTNGRPKTIYRAAKHKDGDAAQ